MKFIRFNRIGNLRNAFVVFPDAVIHSEMARMVMTQNPDSKPISAGFVSITVDQTLSCYGESASLELESRPDDTDLINAQMRF